MVEWECCLKHPEDGAREVVDGLRNEVIDYNIKTRTVEYYRYLLEAKRTLDEVVLDLNRQAASAIPAECRVAVVAGATHLFEEPGTLEQVAVLAKDWFLDHLTPIPVRA